MSFDVQNPHGKSVLDVLLDGGALSASQRSLVEAFAAAWDIDAFSAVVETRVMDETRLAQVLAKGLGLDYIKHLTGMSIPREAFKVVPFATARAHGMLPLGWLDDKSGDDQCAEERRRFWCVVANPLCKSCLDAIRQYAGDRIQIAVAELGAIRHAADRLYPVECQIRCESPAGES